MLPEYICNCFEVTGFDTKEAIIEMNDKTINEIEQYVDKWKKSLPSCLRQDLNMKYDITSMPFEFPLGHRILIQKFISTIKKKDKSAPQKKQKSGPPSKKCKLSHVHAPNAPESIVPEATSCHSEILSATPEIKEKIVNDIRCKVQKWKKDYNKGELAGMKEGDDYVILFNDST